MQTVTAYQTIDGRMFATMAEAIEHESIGIVMEKIDKFLKTQSVENSDQATNLILAWVAFDRTSCVNEGIDTLMLTVRTGNCLKAENIYTIEDLLRYSVQGLLKTPNLGRRSIEEIKEALALKGLFLKVTP